MGMDLENNFLNMELSEQRRMNRQAWLMMVSKGYTSDQKIVLEFAFVTTQRGNAKKLQAFLEELEYKVTVVNNEDEFEISGKTPEMPVSLEDLHQWTARMSEQGEKCGCTFDGWTTAAILKK